MMNLVAYQMYVTYTLVSRCILVNSAKLIHNAYARNISEGDFPTANVIVVTCNKQTSHVCDMRLKAVTSRQCLLI